MLFVSVGHATVEVAMEFAVRMLVTVIILVFIEADILALDVLFLVIVNVDGLQEAC